MRYRTVFLGSSHSLSVESLIQLVQQLWGIFLVSIEIRLPSRKLKLPSRWIEVFSVRLGGVGLNGEGNLKKLG